MRVIEKTNQFKRDYKRESKAQHRLVLKNKGVTRFPHPFFLFFILGVDTLSHLLFWWGCHQRIIT